MELLKTLFIPFEPFPKERPRLAVIHGHPRIITPPATRKAESDIRSALPHLWRMPPVPFRIPIFAQVVCFLERPESVDRRVILPATRADLDNYLKLVLDACNAMVWKDDGCICGLEGWKVYKDPDEKAGYGMRIFRLTRAPEFRVADFLEAR